MPSSILSLPLVTRMLHSDNHLVPLSDWKPDSLREIDIELMRRLSPRVNVIPVIGKADSLTPSELRGFKKRVSDRDCHLLTDVTHSKRLDYGRHRVLRHPRVQLPLRH